MGLHTTRTIIVKKFCAWKCSVVDCREKTKGTERNMLKTDRLEGEWPVIGVNMITIHQTITHSGHSPTKAGMKKLQSVKSSLAALEETTEEQDNDSVEAEPESEKSDQPQPPPNDLMRRIRSLVSLAALENEPEPGGIDELNESNRENVAVENENENVEYNFEDFNNSFCNLNLSESPLALSESEDEVSATPPSHPKKSG